MEQRADDLLKPGFNVRRKDGLYAQVDSDGRLTHFGFYRDGKPKGWMLDLKSASARVSRTVSVEFAGDERVLLEEWVRDHIQTIYSDAEADFLRCSFCQKSNAEVAKLIAGPVVHTYICDECIHTCWEILHGPAEKRNSSSPL